MVCNAFMTDADLIETLGGCTKVSDLLGLPRENGPQRVSNWKVRGIPPKVKLERPDLFLRDLAAGANPQPAEAKAA